MRRPIWKRAGLATAALLAGLTAAAPAQAALLGVTLEFPLLYFRADRSLDYDAETDLFRVEAAPVSLWLDPSLVQYTILPFEGSERVSIAFLVDETGSVIGGVPGDDVVVTGQVTVPGFGTFAGTLLTAEIQDFGWLDTGPGATYDFFDFRFVGTGGLLAPFWPTESLAGLLGASPSTFTGSFAEDFQGGTVGKFMGVPEPATALLLLGGLAGLFAAGRPRR